MFPCVVTERRLRFSQIQFGATQCGRVFSINVKFINNDQLAERKLTPYFTRNVIILLPQSPSDGNDGRGGSVPDGASATKKSA